MHEHEDAANALPAGQAGGEQGTAHLDARALQQLRLLDPQGKAGLLERVLRTFDQALSRQLDQIEAARATDDRATIGLVTHTLKSSSASVGALALSALCAEAEALARQGATAQAMGPRLDALDAEARRVRLAVRAMLPD